MHVPTAKSEGRILGEYRKDPELEDLTGGGHGGAN